MISFRYHIVSIVSVFLALAVGVALGGGPLRGEVDNTLVEQVEADRLAKADLQSTIAGLRSGNDFTDAFGAAVAPQLLGDVLVGRPVTMVVLPNAQQATVSSLGELVAEAGGSVAATVRVGNELVDVSNKGLVEELAAQLSQGVPGLSVPDDATGYERLGALLARAVATDEDRGASADDAANRILSGLSTADLLSLEGDLDQRGSLVVVVSGAGVGAAEDLDGAGAIIASLARAMDAATDGVVVAGPVAAAEEGGAVHAIRSDVVAARDVSTVDALSRVAGQVVVVLALAEQASGGAGHYGIVDAADGAVPDNAADNAAGE